MPEPTRQLAAIFFSDIVGYTTLMGADENKALKILRKSRDIQRTLIEGHGGKWLKEMGDGVLAQFASAVDAVKCSLEIQKKAHSELEAKIRIGLHLGDVTVENKDVFGDGVNIASRIQAIADPGGIYISESINEAIHAQSDMKTNYLAEVELKNVDHPKKIYCLEDKWLPIPPSKKIKELSSSKRSKHYYILSGIVVILLSITGWWFNQSNSDEIRSIAVLPVKNFSGDSSKNILMAGIHTVLRDEIAKIGALRVISSRSTAKYQYQDSLTIPEIAKQLNVDAVIEPDIFEYGENVSIQVRFIKAIPEERQLWSQAFQELAEDVYSIYDEIALSVAEKSGIDLTPDELNQFQVIPKVNPEAHQSYLAGIGYLYKGDQQSLNKAMKEFEATIEKDPEYAPGHLGMVLVWGFKAMMKFVSSMDARPHIEKHLSMAVKLDSTSAFTHYVLATQNTWSFWNWKKADKEFKRTIELDPSNAEARAYYAHYLVFMGDLEEAANQMDKAVELEPYNGWVDGLYGQYLNNTRQFDRAKERLVKNLEDDTNPVSEAALWSNYHNTGLYEKAFNAARQALLQRREYEAVEKLITGNQEGGYKLAMEHVAEAFEIMKDTADFPAWRLATLYVRADNQEKALDWLEQAYLEHSQEMPYLSCDPIFDNVADHPRYQAILDNIGLKRVPK